MYNKYGGSFSLEGVELNKTSLSFYTTMWNFNDEFNGNYWVQITTSHLGKI